jgi:hypothetical protein
MRHGDGRKFNAKGRDLVSALRPNPATNLSPANEPPWVSWRLGGLDLRGDDGLALLMVVEAVDPSEQVPLRGVTGRR